MCRTIVRHYTLCEHTDVEYVHCHPKDIDVDPEAQSNPESPNKQKCNLPIEWRDHSQLECEAHCYTFHCPFCRKEKDNFDQFWQRNGDNIRAQGLEGTFRRPGGGLGFPDGVMAWRRFAENNRDRDWSSMGDDVVVDAVGDANDDDNDLANIEQERGRQSDQLLGSSQERSVTFRLVPDSQVDGLPSATNEPTEPPPRRLYQFPKLQVFVPVFPSNVVRESDSLWGYGLVTSAFCRFGYDDFSDSASRTIREILFRDIRDFSSQLWLVADKMLNDIATEQILTHDDPEGPSTAVGGYWTYKEASATVWSIACLLMCNKAFHEIPVGLQMEVRSISIMRQMRLIFQSIKVNAFRAASRIESGANSLHRLLDRLVGPAPVPMHRTGRRNRPIPAQHIVSTSSRSRTAPLTPVIADEEVLHRQMNREGVPRVDAQPRNATAITEFAGYELTRQRNNRAVPSDIPSTTEEEQQRSEARRSNISDDEESSMRSEDLIEAQSAYKQAQIDVAMAASQYVEGSVCNTLFHFAGCGHFNAISTEKLALLKYIGVFSLRCKCLGFAADLFLSSKATSMQKCLICRKDFVLPENAFNTKDSKDFAEFVFHKNVVPKTRKRDIVLWPFEVSGCVER